MGSHSQDAAFTGHIRVLSVASRGPNASHPSFFPQVVGIKHPERHGYWALQVGAGHRKQKAISLSAAGFFLKQGVPFKHEMAEFKVTEDAIVPVGTTISAAHFVAGQVRWGEGGRISMWDGYNCSDAGEAALKHLHPSAHAFAEH